MVERSYLAGNGGKIIVERREKNRLESESKHDEPNRISAGLMIENYLSSCSVRCAIKTAGLTVGMFIFMNCFIPSPVFHCVVSQLSTETDHSFIVNGNSEN